MAGSANSSLPACGLYVTTTPLPGHEQQFPAGLLVYFHNHDGESDGGLPQVLAPDHNIQNRWHFHGPGVPFRTLSWTNTLLKMPNEGFYVLQSDLAFDGGSWPKGLLVQLGYTRNGDAILFGAQVRAKLEENDLWFSDRGVPISRTQLSILDPVTVFQETSAGAADADHGPSNVH
jgi:hypothetical protein